MHFSFDYSYQQHLLPEEEAYWFIFRNEKILTRIDDGVAKPLWARTADIAELDPANALHVGLLNSTNCYAVLDQTEKGMSMPHTEWISLRFGYGKIDDEMFQIYGRARHLLLWAENNRFCGRCGHPTALKSDERCFLCPACGFSSYPRISPAVIVSIEKDGQLLLARGTRFQMEIYSVLAGFVEPGESLEECLRREVKEEVGIDIKNIRYFKSQPWPFPDSLMIAYTAEYAGGKLSIDPNEIVDAGWYAPDNLPNLPGKLSIARALIDHFIEKNRSLPK